MNQEARIPDVDELVRQCLDEVGLGRSARSGDREVLRATHHSRVASPVWVPGGMEESCSRQESKVFPAGRPAALRRIRRVASSRPRRTSAGPSVARVRWRARRVLRRAGRAAASA